MSETLRGSCHCGAVEFEVTVPNGLQNLRRCSCSICRRKGAIMSGVPRENLTIRKGASQLSLYQFNTQVAEHYFCSVCGIYTHHRRRSNPDEYGFNVGCLVDIDPFDLGEIEVVDGINHPSDRTET